MLKVLFLEILLCFSISAFNQQSNLYFRQLTTSDGLSQSWVRCIHQDKLGYMWFGTDDGLNRFDGVDFKVYRTIPKEEFSLDNVSINYIKQKSENELWICTDQGINIYHQDLDIFTSFPYMSQLGVYYVYVDNKGLVWFGTSAGLHSYNPKDSSVVSYSHDPEQPSSISSNTIRVIFQDSRNNFWIGTDQGLNLFIPESHSFIRYSHTQDPNSLISDDIHAIVEDARNRVWLGASQGGLVLFMNAFERPSQGIFRTIIRGSVSELYIDKKQQLWVGNGSNIGLFILDLNLFSIDKKLKYRHLKTKPGVKGCISKNTITAIYEDEANDIWLGTYGGGINYHSPREKRFTSVKKVLNEHNSLSDDLVNAFLEDDQYLWIGTESGLDRIDKKTGRFFHFYWSNDPADLRGSSIYALFKDSKGFLWYGSWAGGLNQYDPVRQTFKNYTADNEPGSLCSANVFSIYEDSRGNLWIGTIRGGLNLFDRKTGKFQCFINDPNDPGSLTNDAVNDILETRDGKLYVSVYEAIDVFDYETKKFSHYRHNPDDSASLNSGQTTILFEDSKANLWIGTTMGLDLFHKSSDHFIHYTTGNGLPNNTIQGILEDDHGNLWISTNSGLSKFVRAVDIPSNPVFHNYSKEDGLSSDEFTVRSVYKNSEGKMYFGSSEGYTSFFPDSILQNSLQPAIIFTDFQLERGMMEPDDLKALLKSFYSEGKIRLNHSQSDFTIRFAALNYLNSTKNQYIFKLDGYEDHWHSVGNQRFASYTSIDPGDYTFLVMGSNNDGVWCASPLSLSIHITPPWWKTWLFRIFLVLFIVGLILLFYWLRISILKEQKRVLEIKVLERTNELAEANILLEERQEEITQQNEELSKHRNNLEALVTERTVELEAAKKKAQESDRLKSAFLANISHEIRTPMNAIVGFSSLIDDESTTEKDRIKFIEAIKGNSDTLLVLINDIIDISLIEADQLVLNKVVFNVNTILMELEEYFKLKNDKPIEFALDQQCREQKLILNNDQVRFRQIFTNLLSNAFKYTHSGVIRFGYRLNNDQVCFYVSDTGMGISEKDQNKVFDYFRKIEHSDDRFYQGAGIGLTICKKLVEQMGGTIWLESKEGTGSTFYFTLPYSAHEPFDHPKTPVSSVKFRLNETNILVAEDDETNFELVKAILRPTLATVIRARNGKEAIEYIRNNPSGKNCLVLMDIKMPVIDGIIACKEIKQINASIPVVAITAYAQPNDRPRLLQENFDEYISKPIDPHDLLKVINRLINSESS